MKKLTLLTFVFAYQVALGQDLVEILELAQSNDPGYKSEILSLSADKLDAKIAAGKFLPEVSVALSGIRAPSGADEILSTSKLKLSATIPIYDPKSIANYKQSKIKSQSAVLNKKSFKTKHTLDITNSYFDALIAHASYETKLSALRQYKRSHEEALEMARAGLKTHVDTLTSLSALDLGRVDAVQAKNHYNQSIKKLQGKLDTAVSELNGLAYNQIPSFSLSPLNELISQGLESSTRVKKAQLGLKKSQQELSSSYGTFIPSAKLSVSTSQTLADAKDEFLADNTSNIETSLSLSVSVFSGLSDYHKLKKETLKFHAAEHTFQDEVYDIRLHIEERYSNYENTHQRAVASLSAMQSSEASLEAINEKSLAGTATELEVMSAITQAAKAKDSFSSACFDLMKAYLGLCAATGNLNQEAINNVNHYLTAPVSLAVIADPSQPM